MSIIAYTGLMGSGKSYGVVENVILPAMEAGRHIVTNLALKTGTLTDDYPNGKVTIISTNDEFDYKLDDYPGAVWILDEVHKIWPAGLKMNNVSTAHKEFFTEHRHSVGADGLTSEIVLVTQDLGQLASFARNLVEDTYRATKLSAVGLNKHYMVHVFQGPATGAKPTGSYRTLRGTYKPEVFKYYRTHTKNKTDFAAGMEEKVDDRANVWKNPLVRLGIPLALIFTAYCLYTAAAYFTKPEPTASEVPTNYDQARSIPLRSAQKSSEKKAGINYARYDIDADKPELSDTWRIVGRVDNQFILDSTNGYRIVPTARCLRDTLTFEDYCIVGGQRVTWYSSSVPDPDRRESAIEKIDVL